jgi:putative ABC transport system permease protein
MKLPWFYRMALRTLPAQFRRDYGDEMVSAYAELAGEARRKGGVLGSAVFHLKAVGDLARTAYRERPASQPPSSRRGKGQFMDTLLCNLRVSWRYLRAKPGFTAIVLVTLAVAIGANSAIFEVVNAVLVRPLPFQDPQRLVILKESDTETGAVNDSASAGDFEDWRAMSKSFEAVAAFVEASMNLTGEGEPERLIVYRTSPALFRVLGVEATWGRCLIDEDDREGAPAVALLTYGLWQRRFGGSRDVVGKAVLLDDEPHEVVGVLPRGLHFPSHEAALFVPHAMASKERNNRRSHYLKVIGRLKRGATIDEARHEMQAIALHLAEKYPDTNANESVGLFPLQEELVGEMRTPLLVLLGAVGCVLLLACVNLANLLMARMTSRRREVAVRLALGANRSKLVGQFLTEALVLSLVGGSLGLLLSFWTGSLFASLVPEHIVLARAPWNLSTLLFTLVLSTAVGLGLGILPALSIARDAASSSLLDGGGRGAVSSRVGAGVRRFLIVGEVALAFVLLVGAGLMIQSFQRLTSEDPGFRAESVLTMRIELSPTKYQEHPRRVAFYRELLERVERIPGVVSAGFVSMLPLTFQGGSTMIDIEHRPAPEDQEPIVVFRSATPDYFGAMGIPLLRGRLFGKDDDAHAPKVVVVNEALERDHFDGESALGAHLKIWSGSYEYEIVGVVGNVQAFGLGGEARPVLYVPALQRSYGWFDPRDLAVRTRTDPQTLAASIRAQVRAIDPDQPVSFVRTMEDIVEGSVSAERLQTLVLSVFGGTALILAALGIYGVLCFTVIQRTNEIGLRMALGARSIDVVHMVLGQGMRWVFVGALLGLFAALGLTNVLAGMLYEIEPTDPATLAGIMVLLAAVALVACLIPGLRATRVDPLIALRED